MQNNFDNMDKALDMVDQEFAKKVLQESEERIQQAEADNKVLEKASEEFPNEHPKELMKQIMEQPLFFSRRARRARARAIKKYNKKNKK